MDSNLEHFFVQVKYFYLDYRKPFILVVIFSQIMIMILFLPIHTFLNIFFAAIMSDNIP